MRAVSAVLLAASFAIAQIQPIKIGARFESIMGVALQNAPATVVIFVSTECPISNDYNERMNALYRDYSGRNVQFLFLNANNNESAAKIQKHSADNDFAFKVLKDMGNEWADKLGATATPEAYVFDRSGTLVYHGYIDDSRNVPTVKVRALRDAIDSVLSGKPVARPETRAFGCTIKRVKKSI